MKKNSKGKDILEKIVECKREHHQKEWDEFEKTSECFSNPQKYFSNSNSSENSKSSEKSNTGKTLNSIKSFEKRFILPAAKRSDDFFLIAECKKTSPSKGKLAKKNYDPPALAKNYEQAGASAISVLCEKFFFEGSIDDLKKVRQATALPLLQKDFIIHEKQLFDGYLAGANLSLLIVRLLSLKRLCQLIDYARALGLGYLIEIYEQDDVEKVLALVKQKKLREDRSCLIGINNRNLATFEVDFHHAFRLKNQLPSDLKIISESGMEKPQDLLTIKQQGFFGALVGEMLMRSDDVKKTIGKMFEQMKSPLP